MEVKIGGSVLSLVRGDITEEETEAIANAANSRLAGGGGVDGAIHRAGGPSIMAECRKIGSCPTGRAVITTGGNLKARYVIHGVGPVYRGGTKGEPALLRSVYEEILKIASERGIKSIAFPSISTGVYGYPIEEASRIALSAVIDFLERDDVVKLVRFVLFSDKDLAVYEDALREIMEKRGGKGS
jgi:O-acetyl-ADP-ribose deacetylase (regulator of RNase III)